jgi:ankyrin repeat protein
VAALEGHLAIVQYLVQQGADINQGLRGFTALAIATRAGHIAVARYLREQGAI